MNGSESPSNDIIHVGVGEWKIATTNGVLRTTLGSCVGVVLYSQKSRTGGIAHVLLASPPSGKIANKGKYAGTAIEMMLFDLKKAGVEPEEIVAAIFGGASMFRFEAQSYMKNIGADNVRVVKETLDSKKIPVVFEDTGGTEGRTVSLHVDDGAVTLRIRENEKIIGLAHEK